MDRSPLPVGALVRFQVIARAPFGVKGNYRYVLYPDGRIILRRHVPLPSERSELDELSGPPPKGTRRSRISSSAAQRVEARLRAARFLEQRAYQATDCKDGASYVVTARLDGRVRRVTYECAYPPLVELLDTIGQHFL